MTDSVRNELCDIFMKRMRIEGDDGSEQRLIIGYMQSGEVYLSDIACGCEIDFKTDRKAMELLYNYVFYVRNECLAEFEKNYGAMLRNLRNAARVRKRREENAEAEEQN